MIPMPAVAEERALALGRPAVWRRLSIIAQAVLFFLTAIGIAALFWLCDLLQLPKGWTTAIVSLALAELLIVRGHFWRTGVESALWLGGLFAIILGFQSSGKPEAILLFAAASALAGWRVRNALFGTLAIVLAAVYLMAKDQPWPAAGFSIAVTVAALVAELRVWQRPSTEYLWRVLLVVMPIVGYEALDRGDIRGFGIVAMFAVMAFILGAIGVRLRLRIVLLSSAVSAALAAIELGGRIRISEEAYLIACGAIVLAIAVLLMRRLRGRESGFVLAEERHEIDEALQIAATLPLAAPSATPTRPAPGGGGEFGGAGASGQF